MLSMQCSHRLQELLQCCATAASAPRVRACNVAEVQSQHQVTSDQDSVLKQQMVSIEVNKLLQADPHVKFMLEKLESVGCRMPPERIVLTECKEEMLGSFELPDLKICYNYYRGNVTELRNTLVHELVHAYDFCRAKNLDFFNCKHLACTEVRAAHLSGDCSMRMEAARGHWPSPGYEKACVKRRAQMSVAMLPHCKHTALAHVLSCLDECYQDTEPYSRPP